MLANLSWFAGGLVAMIVGAEALVRGGSRLASRLGIRPIMVGLTVVSIGTSMPELAVGVVAATEGNGSLAVGNIAGTNMVNLLLILGLSAVILPLAIQMQTLRFDLPVIAAAASLLGASRERCAVPARRLGFGGLRDRLHRGTDPHLAAGES